MMARVLVALFFMVVNGVTWAETEVYFQAHRGGMNEAPENTLLAVERAWGIPGAVPEVDLQTTADGVIVCLHDDTPERTTNAPLDEAGLRIKEVTLEQVKRWDAGIRFDAQYAGTRVPTLREIFDAMRGNAERQVNLDLKAVKVEEVVALIDEYGLREQVWWVHGNPAMCEKLSQLWPGSRVMTWISDPPELLKKRFERMKEKDFHGVSLLQFHLHAAQTGPPINYELDDAYLKEVIDTLSAKGIHLQIRPFEFDAESLRCLIDLGVIWYVTDDPAMFRASVEAAVSLER